jgi:hypothetical protein
VALTRPDDGDGGREVKSVQDVVAVAS